MAESQWLRILAPRPGATAQIICFPHAGGAASAFRTWADRVPSSVEVAAVQYPGRQDRLGERLPPDLATLAEWARAAIEPRLRRPTAFFGHSMGATVAFEVARLLRPRFPSPLARLFVSACRAPFARRPPLRADAEDEEIRSYVRSLNGAGSAGLEEEEMWRLALPALRHDFGLIDGYRYRPGAPLSCPITAIAGDRDESVSPADVARWAELTVGPFESHVLPGGHFYFDDAPPHIASVLGNWEWDWSMRKC